MPDIAADATNNAERAQIIRDAVAAWHDKHPQQSPAPAYDREAFIDVLVHHPQTSTSGCGLGCMRLGESYPEHIADVYEASVAAR